MFFITRQSAFASLRIFIFEAKKSLLHEFFYLGNPLASPCLVFGARSPALHAELQFVNVSGAQESILKKWFLGSLKGSQIRALLNVLPCLYSIKPLLLAVPTSLTASTARCPASPGTVEHLSEIV
jgi:hypothetical protein